VDARGSRMAEKGPATRFLIHTADGEIVEMLGIGATSCGERVDVAAPLCA
jgi:hypothetical protein